MVTRAAQDYYEALGVSKDADKKAIKSAYRQKVGGTPAMEQALCGKAQHVVFRCSAQELGD